MSIRWGAVLGCLLVSACGGSASDASAGAGSGGLGSGGGSNSPSGGSAGLTQADGGTGASNAPGGASAGGTAGASLGGTAGASPGPCLPTPACGGAVLGVWHVSNICSGNLARQDAACPSATSTVVIQSVSGTFTFNADATTQTNLQTSFAESVLYPPACFTADECAQLAAATLSNPDVSSVNCSYDVNAGCSCALVAGGSSASSGTYRVTGNTITLQSSTQTTPENDTFCVAGNIMTIQNVDAQGNISTIALTR